MNNKAFTLVELLAVVIILSLLALIATTSISKVINGSKEDLYQTQLESFKASAESWGSENVGKLPEAGTCKFLTLGDLKEYGLIDKNVKDPRTNNKFKDSLKIKITASLTSLNKVIYQYEVNPSSVTDCEKINLMEDNV